LIITVSILVGWLIILVYRCTFFVLQLMASVKLMPMEAARIVAAYRAGGQTDYAETTGEATKTGP
jgi:hypothetical protein